MDSNAWAGLALVVLAIFVGLVIGFLVGRADNYVGSVTEEFNEETDMAGIMNSVGMGYATQRSIGFDDGFALARSIYEPPLIMVADTRMDERLRAAFIKHSDEAEAAGNGED